MTLEDHREMGRRLKECYCSLVHIICDLSQVNPMTSTANNQLERAQKSIRAARFALENRFIAEYPGEKNNAYFPTDEA